MDLDEAQKHRVMQLNEIYEIRKDDIHRSTLIRDQRDKWHDKFIKKTSFQPCDWALLYDNGFKFFKGKLSTRWLGPYEVDTLYDNDSIKIKTIDEDQTIWYVLYSFPSRFFFSSRNMSHFFPHFLCCLDFSRPLLGCFSADGFYRWFSISG
jgi:hypothetical protein